MNINEFAQNLDLTKPLDAGVLNSLSTVDLKVLRRVIHERAKAIIGEIASLKEESEFGRKQFKQGLFRCEHFLASGEQVCKFELFSEAENFFAPGEWFEEFLSELETLRARHAENIELFPVREKARIVEQLLGEKLQAKAA